MDVLDLFRLPIAALILMLPGLVVGWVLAPRGTGWLPRVTWGLGASMSVLMVGGVILNAANALGTGGWLSVLLLLAVMMSGSYWLARKRTPSPGANIEMAAVQSSTPQEGISGIQVAMLLVALCIVVGAVSVARTGAEESMRKPSTELWAVAKNGQIVLGVNNREGKVMHYRVELKIGNTVRETWELPAMAADSIYEHRLPEASRMAKVDASTQVLLYLVDESAVYRHVSFAN